MNRLTGWDKNNAYCLKCFENGGCPDMDTSRCDFCEHHIAVYDRLARYEDTSLMPEDVVRLNDFSKSQAVKLLEKNGRLKAAINQALSWLTPNLGDGSRAVEKARQYLIAEMEQMEG